MSNQFPNSATHPSFTPMPLPSNIQGVADLPPLRSLRAHSPCLGFARLTVNGPATVPVSATAPASTPHPIPNAFSFLVPDPAGFTTREPLAVHGRMSIELLSTIAARLTGMDIGDESLD